MHDWRNFNIVSIESIMVILYDKSITTVIHPGTWSQHPFVSGFFFFWDALYKNYVQSPAPHSYRIKEYIMLVPHYLNRGGGGGGGALGPHFGRYVPRQTENGGLRSCSTVKTRGSGAGSSVKMRVSGAGSAGPDLGEGRVGSCPGAPTKRGPHKF